MNTQAFCYCPVAAEAESIRQYTFSIYQSVSEISSFFWDNHIPAGNLLMKHDYLKLIEETHKETMAFRYVQVKQNNSTVGTIYFQIVNFEGAQLINYFPSGTSRWLHFLRNISTALLKRINLKMLVSGNVFMTGENGYYFSAGIDKATRGKLLRKAIRTVMDDDKTIKAALISDLYAPKTEFDEGFKPCGYNEITVESDMSITLKPEWKTFDDYLAALTSKYRVRAKKVFARCNEYNVVCKELDAAAVAANEERLYELYNKVMANADFKLAVLSKNYFKMQKQQLPDNYKVFAYFKDNLMIGFISAFVNGKKVEVHYTGMDHEICKPIHLYQHMMYDMVKLGIETRAERLHFGRTAPEIKSTIGATPAPMYGYLKHRNLLFNSFVVKPYTANLRPKQYTFRHPFK